MHDDLALPRIFFRIQSDDLKSEALIVEAVIMGSAAGKAGDSPLG
jgi:hypothetical protein